MCRLSDQRTEDPFGGAGWTLLGFAASRAITFAITLVLARLLMPADFGLVAIAGLLLLTISTATGLGLAGTVVLAAVDRPLLRTTFTLLIAAGVAGAGIIAVFAPMLADLFDLPKLAPVLRVLSLTLVAGAVVTLFDAVLQRELRFRDRFVTQLVQATTYAVVSLVAAAAGAGVWSLVAGQLAGTLALAMALVRLAPYTVVPGFDVRQVRRSVTPARGFLAHSVIEHLQHNSDVAVAGFRLGSAAAGQYAIAFRLADLPYFAITEPLATVAFPALAREHRRREPTDQLGLDLLALVTLFACPLGILMSAAADPLVATLLGEKWAGVVAPLTVLGLWSAVAQVEGALGWLLNSTGSAGTTALVSACVTVPLVPALFVGASVAGLAGIAWAVLAGSLTTVLGLMLGVYRHNAIPFRRQAAAFWVVVLASAVSWGVTRLAVAAGTGAPPLVTLLASLGLGLSAYVLVLHMCRPALLRRGMSFVSGAFGVVRSNRRSSDDPGGKATPPS